MPRGKCGSVSTSSSCSRRDCQGSSRSLQPLHNVPYSNLPIVEHLAKRPTSPLRIHSLFFSYTLRAAPCGALPIVERLCKRATSPLSIHRLFFSRTRGSVSFTTTRHRVPTVV